MGLLDGFFTLAADTNKVNETDTDEGVISEYLPELALDMEDDELVDLSKMWIKEWEPYAAKAREIQDENENYWLGVQFSEGGGSKRPLVDNLIFESFETFLPVATKPKADPTVDLVNKEGDPNEAVRVRDRLSKLGDDLSYNLQLKQTARFWGLYLLGAYKVGYSMINDDITGYVIRPQKLVLDPDATMEEGEYTGDYVGEYRSDTASKLIIRFPKKADYIKSQANNKMGTKLQYIEWWTDEYVFWTLKDQVLNKSKNPHWNYETDEPMGVDEYGNQPVDMNGQPTTQKVPGKNHLKHPEDPYIFLSIFNLGKHPLDDTNIIKQVLPLQDLINKRLAQMDKNADSTNNGMVVSGDAFTKEQAKTVSDALRKGATVWQPTGNVNQFIKRDPAPALPNFIYETLNDYRNELRNIFGSRGLSAQGLANQHTVRGMVLAKGLDEDRIAGGISSYLESFSEQVFNYFTQMMYVYDQNPPKEEVKVTIKDGSMIPKDPVSLRNEAIQLWGEKALDPITFFERLEFPNPRESAKQLYLWMSDPAQLFPDIPPQPQQQEKPSESINYKDVPPEAQAQMLNQAGIEIDPIRVAQHNDLLQTQNQPPAQVISDQANNTFPQ